MGRFVDGNFSIDEENCLVKIAQAESLKKRFLFPKGPRQGWISKDQ